MPTCISASEGAGPRKVLGDATAGLIVSVLYSVYCPVSVFSLLFYARNVAVLTGFEVTYYAWNFHCYYYYFRFSF